VTAVLGHRRTRQRLRGGAVIIGAAAALVYVAATNWAGNAVTFSSVLAATIAGVSVGAIYALAATGLVVTYTTSGIFNFAQGAIGMFMAFVYWQLTQEVGLAEFPAIVLVVGVIAPATGVLLDRYAMNRAARSGLVVQLMATVALMVFLMGLAAWIWNPNESRNIPYLFTDRGFHIGDTFVLWHRAITIVAGVVIAIGLRVFLRRSRTGLAMRAVVDSPTLAAMYGARPQRASSLAWALGSSLAALAGILLAPEVLMSVEGLTLLIVNAFAAAIIGRLRSLPWTVAGGLLIGLLSAFSLSFLELQGRWAGVQQAIPTIVLFVALLALPAAPIVAGRRAARLHTRVPHLWEAVLAGVALVALLAFFTSDMATTTQNRVTSGLVVALVLVPLVPLIGWTGQVALAPLTFAGVGAYVMVEYAVDGSLWGLLGAAAMAIPFGLAMALPALRLQGLYFALASVAFARSMELLFFAQADVLAGRSEVVQRPEIFGVSFAEPHPFLILCAIAFAVIMVGLVGLRRSRYGRRLIAMRDSSAACTTVGLDVRKIKLAVFCLSAALGAVAGALLAMQRGTPTAPDFSMFASLTLVMFLVMGGVTLIAGALFAGWAGFLFSWITATWSGTLATAVTRIGPGGLAAGVSQNPNGIAGEIARGWSQLLPWRPDARAAARRAALAAHGADPKVLGVEVPFSEADVRRMDDRLGVPVELRGAGGTS
jgi:branched-chain amino acid transport system permease protein